jgi:RNA polymerase sigma-54 factor
MRIGPSLILASRQTLAMTPQLQQAIKLLQFSHLELAAFIQQELEKNPLLSEGTADDGPIAEAEGPVLDAPADTAEALAAAAPALAEADERWTREHADRGGDGAATKGSQREDAPDALDFVAERPRSLAVHVLEQIELMFSDSAERRIALKLAEGLDEAGYCRLDAAAVAEAVCVSLEMVEAVGARLRQIEPAGLFSRTVSECLGAQLAERDRLDPAMKALLDNLDLVAAGELGQLRRRCGVDDEDLRDMLAELRTLDPRPGQDFDYEPIQPVAPDLFLAPRIPRPAKRTRHIELNTDALPKVLVDRNYHATLMKGARAEPTAISSPSASSRPTAGQDLSSAPRRSSRWRAIIRQQDGFFRKGVSALRPLVLRDIARHRIAREHGEPCHLQQVHRRRAASSSLSISSPRLCRAHTGRGRLSESVRLRIRLLVGGENSPAFADDRIVDLLNGEGIEIARRTVAKYREAMRIPSSAERRRLGRLGMGRSLPSGVPSAAVAAQILAGPAD